MDRLSQILDNLKERLTNPLIFSFIVSWVFFNWPIIVSLLWYDSPANTEDNLSLIDFISVSLSPGRSFWYPFVFAIAYTLLSPVIKNLIQAFQSFNLKWGDQWTTKIMKASIVPMEKYLKLRRNLENKTQELEAIIQKENVTIDELQTVRQQLLDLKNQNSDLQQQLNVAKTTISNVNRMDLLQGQWLRTTRNGIEIIRESIEINNNNMYVFNGNMREQKYSIHNFRYSPTDKQAIFTLFHNSSANPSGFFAFNELTLRHGNLTGREYGNNYSADIVYSKEDSEEDPSELLEEDSQLIDREYWLNKATPETMKIVDEMMKLINHMFPGGTLRYRRNYIGVDHNGSINNSIIFKPKKEYTRVELRIPESTSIDTLIKNAGIETMEYRAATSRYRLKLSKGDVIKHEGVLGQLLVASQV